MSEKSNEISPTSRFYNLPFIRELINIEIRRARRYGRSFSAIAVEIDNFEALRKRLPDKEGLLQFLKGVATTIMDLTRQCDIVGMINKKDFLVMLPETDYFGALVATRRLRKALYERYKDSPVDFFLIPVSGLEDGRTFEALLERASSRIEGYRKSLFHTLRLREKGFHDCVRTLLEGTFPSSEEWNKSSSFSATFVKRLQDFVLKEIMRTPGTKGLLYISSFPGEGLLSSFLRSVERIDDLKTKIHIIDGRGEGDYPETIYFFKGDEAISSLSFILFYRKDFSYAFLGREEDERIAGFHTMDPYLVEGLIDKLEEHCLERALP